MTMTTEAISEITQAVTWDGFYSNADGGYNHSAATTASRDLTAVCEKHGITRSEARAIHWQQVQASYARKAAGAV